MCFISHPQNIFIEFILSATIQSKVKLVIYSSGILIMKQMKIILIITCIFIILSCSEEKNNIPISRNYATEDVTGKIEEPEITIQDSSTASQSVTENIQPSNASAQTDIVADYTQKDLLPDPKKFPDLKLSNEPEFFVGQDLYEYIDGGAELYHSLGFRQVVTAEYQSRSNPEMSVIVDIYDMTNQENASEIYSTQKSPTSNSIDIGIEGIIGGGEIIFFKDKYFCKVTTFSDTEESNNLIKKLAQEVANNINGDDKSSD